MPTALEVVKTALFNEVKSRAFYRLAAEITERDDARVLFMELADLEVGHARDLARRFSELPFARDFDAVAYVEAVEGTITATLSPADEHTVREGSPREVLRLAQRLEAEARDSYRTLSRLSPSPEAKRYYENLSRQEQGHLDQLIKLERSLEMPVEARPPL